MGKMLYGKASFKAADQDLAYLDAVLAQAHAEGLTFQFHITLGGEADWGVVSLTLGAGCPVLIEYANVPREFDWAVIVAAVSKIKETGMLGMGFFSGV